MVTEITGSSFKDMIINASNAINAQKQIINDLNVFPVPDGDTGTNMSLTIGTASAELKKCSPGTVSEAADVTASAEQEAIPALSCLFFSGASQRL